MGDPASVDAVPRLLNAALPWARRLASLARRAVLASRPTCRAMLSLVTCLLDPAWARPVPGQQAVKLLAG